MAQDEEDFPAPVLPTVITVLEQIKGISVKKKKIGKLSFLCPSFPIYHQALSISLHKDLFNQPTL